MLRSPLRSPFVDLLRPSVGVAGLSIVQQAIGILRSYGADAHIYLPGVGTVNGITAGNYLESTGVTAATVDNPVGLSLDALQAMTLGSELVTNGANLVSTTGWTATALSGAPASLSVSGGSLVVTNTGTTYGVAAQTVPVTSGLTYQISALLTKGTAAAVNIRVGSTAFGYEYTVEGVTGIAVPITATFKATSSNVFISLLNTNTPDGTGIYGKISVREIPGIHATQATTANKPILRQSGGKYSWQFDGSNDSLLTGNLGITNTVSVVIAGVLNSLPTTTVFANEGVNGFQILIRNTGVIDCLKAGVEPIISAASGTIVAGVPFVLTFRLQGGVSVLRKNGAQVSTAAYAPSLSATAGLSLGAASNSINGSIYSVDVITATTTDSDLLTLERLAGQLSGVSM